MAEEGGQAGERVPAGDASSLALIEAGSVETLPRSKNVVLVDPSAPQDFDLTVPNLHYGSQPPITGATGSTSVASATEAVTINPLAPSLAPVPATGLEGTAIALN